VTIIPIDHAAPGDPISIVVPVYNSEGSLPLLGRQRQVQHEVCASRIDLRGCLISSVQSPDVHHRGGSSRLSQASSSGDFLLSSG